MDRVPTGVKGLDEVLGGGLPKSRVALVVGSPGSGKTTFVMQFLYSGAKAGDLGLYVTLDEKPEQIKENLAGFRWDLEKEEQEGRLIFIDGTPLRRVNPPTQGYSASEAIMMGLPELTLPRLIRTIRKITEEEGVQRVAVDPITSLMIRYGDVVRRRRNMLLFFDALSSTNCTCLVTTELRTSMLDRRFQLEEFVSQGVILLHSMVHNGNVVRAIQVEKMRGIAHDTQLRPYQISTQGIEVFPKDRVF